MLQPAATPLTPDQQQAYLQMLSRGASSAAACGHLGLTLASVRCTLAAEPTFAERLRQVQELLSQNVAAALYRSAMEGSVTAQTFFLKNCPPPDWPEGIEPAAPADDLEEISDQQLLRHLRSAMAQLEADLAPPLDQGVPQAPS